jgi:hypothetical protein
MQKENLKMSKSTTLSIIFLILFIILLIILPIVFFSISCILIIGDTRNSIIIGIILTSHLLYLLPVLPQRKLNKKIFVSEIIITIIMFIISLIFSIQLCIM